MSPKRSASRPSPGWAERLARVRGAQLAVVVGLAIASLLLYVNLSSSERKVEHPIPHLYATADSQFVRTMGNLLGPAFVPGNRITSLLNGDQTFPAMLEAIRSARRTITFESYIYWSSRVGREITEALSERARAGVRTHLLLDWAGSQKVDQGDLELMRKAGVRLVRGRARGARRAWLLPRPGSRWIGAGATGPCGSGSRNSSRG
jgi:cardiolipin synthase